VIPSHARGAARGVDVAKRGGHGLHGTRPRGVLSPFTCPACHGSLWESRERELSRFTCHVGHTFSAESLMKSHDGDLENALWSAVQALEENGALRRRMAAHARRRELETIAHSFDRQAEGAEHQANLIRAIVVNSPQTQDDGLLRRRKRAPRTAARE